MKDSSNHRSALDELGKKLRFTNQNDWYRITTKDFEENGLKKLLQSYDGSPMKAGDDYI